MKIEHVWLVGVKNAHRGKYFSPTSLKYFRTRKECQEFINTDKCIAMWTEPGRNQLEYKPLKAQVSRA